MLYCLTSLYMQAGLLAVYYMLSSPDYIQFQVTPDVNGLDCKKINP